MINLMDRRNEIKQNIDFALEYLNDSYITVDTGSWAKPDNEAKCDAYEGLGKHLLQYRNSGGDMERLRDVILAYWAYRNAWECEGSPVFEAERDKYLKAISEVDLGIRCLVRTICEEDMEILYKTR